MQQSLLAKHSLPTTNKQLSDFGCKAARLFVEEFIPSSKNNSSSSCLRSMAFGSWWWQWRKEKRRHIERSPERQTHTHTHREIDRLESALNHTTIMAAIVHTSCLSPIHGFSKVGCMMMGPSPSVSNTNPTTTSVVRRNFAVGGGGGVGGARSEVSTVETADQLVQLGKSDVRVSQIGIGAWSWGDTLLWNGSWDGMHSILPHSPLSVSVSLFVFLSLSLSLFVDLSVVCLSCCAPIDLLVIRGDGELAFLIWVIRVFDLQFWKFCCRQEHQGDKRCIQCWNGWWPHFLWYCRCESILTQIFLSLPWIQSLEKKNVDNVLSGFQYS